MFYIFQDVANIVLEMLSKVNSVLAISHQLQWSLWQRRLRTNKLLCKFNPYLLNRLLIYYESIIIWKQASYSACLSSACAEQKSTSAGGNSGTITSAVDGLLSPFCLVVMILLLSNLFSVLQLGFKIEST
jgi:hypothetical protein